MPPGVINLVVGHDHDATAGVLCASPAVRKLSFTGSTRVGQVSVRICAAYEAASIQFPYSLPSCSCWPRRARPR